MAWSWLNREMGEMGKWGSGKVGKWENGEMGLILHGPGTRFLCSTRWCVRSLRTKFKMTELYGVSDSTHRVLSAGGSIIKDVSP